MMKIATVRQLMPNNTIKQWNIWRAHVLTVCMIKVFRLIHHDNHYNFLLQQNYSYALHLVFFRLIVLTGKQQIIINAQNGDYTNFTIQVSSECGEY